MQPLQEQFSAFGDRFERLRDEIQRVFVGHSTLVERVLICLFCRGHVLIEGLPGLGKTLLVKTLSEALDLSFARIQCTPDLMPADIIGTHMLIEDSKGSPNVRFQKGPIFSHVLLADEVNRATPKTQSAFLEAMQERGVTASGTTYPLAEPFFLLATQNPIEMEGTYPLPEAQLDRFFFKLEVDFPQMDELSRIVDLTTSSESPVVAPVCDRRDIEEMCALVRRVKIAERVKRFALRIVLASHPQGEESPAAVRDYVRYGASPRAAQSMILGAKVRAVSQGRYHVAVEDLRDVAEPSLLHRILLNFEGEVAKITPSDIARELLANVEP